MPVPAWAEKHAPKKMSDFAGNADACAKVKKWGLEWGRGNSGKPLCLWGPAGSGKTAMANTLSCELGWDACLVSPYDFSDAESFGKALSSALSGGGLFGRVLVVFDGVDLWSKSGVRGSIPALARELGAVRAPAILTATNWYDRSLMPLRTLAEPVPLKSINSSDISRALDPIIQQEGVHAKDDEVKQIVLNSSGDLRAAINDLQAQNFSALREKEKQVLEKVRSSIRAPNYKTAKSLNLGVLQERDTLKLYIAENLPSEFPDINDRARAMARLSRADVFDGRIMGRQYWGYLRYSSDLLVWGVASERLHPGAAFASYSFPSYISKMGASKARRALLASSAKKISARTHTTTKSARAYFPLLSIQKDAAALSSFYGFDEDEIAALLGATPKSPPPKVRKKG